MDFGKLLSVAEKNSANKQTSAYYPTKLAPPKRETKQSKALSQNIKKFLAKKEEEERQKKLEEQKKRENLLALRDQKAQTRINKHLKVCKSANKSVILDAVNQTDTAVTIAGPSQPDEDDYGYVSQEAAAFYNKLMTKYNSIPQDKPLFSENKKVVKDIASTKDRVKQALRQHEIEESTPGRRKRKTTGGPDKDEPREKEPNLSKDKSNEKDDKPQLKKRPAVPPPPDFMTLLKIAEKKQHEPIVLPPKEKPKMKRLMNKKELLEFQKYKEWKLNYHRDQAAPETQKTGSNPISANNTKSSSKTVPTKVPSKPNGASSKPKSILEKALEKPKSPPNGVPKRVSEKSVEKSIEKQVEKTSSSSSKVTPKDALSEERKKLEAERRELEALRRKIAEEKRQLAMSRSSNKPSEDKNKVAKSNGKVEKSSSSSKDVKSRQIPPTDVKSKQSSPSDVKSKQSSPSDLKSKQSSPSDIKPRQFPPSDVKARQPPPNNIKPRQFPPADCKPRQFPPADCKPRQFPPPDVRRNKYPTNDPRFKRPSNPKLKLNVNKRRIYDDDDEEYDSELDDFIDDNEVEETEDYREHIYQLFGYDKSKYAHLDDDDCNMETSYSQQLKEEYHSTKMGIMEDLEDMRQEALEKKRKAAIKKKPRK